MSALSIAGVEIREPPAEDPNAAELFKTLGERFKLAEEVVQYFVGTLKLQSLHDFAHLFAAETDVQPVIDKVGLGDGAPLQVARTRRAWQAIRDAVAESRRMKEAGAEDPDLDAPLTKADQDKATGDFWKRHKLPLPPHVEPCDQLVGRLVRELHLRLLCVYFIWKVQTQNQFGKSKDKPELTGDGPKNVWRYLLKLRTLCIAYAIAGTKSISKQGAPPEIKGTISADYIEGPLDVFLKYYFRAEERALQVADTSPAEALRWLSNRDEADRTAWVDLVRNTDLPIGKIVLRVMMERESTWTVDSDLYRKHTQPISERPEKARKVMGPDTSIRVATMTDGTPLCDLWNSGACTGPGVPCPHELLHGCDGRLRNGRACGMRNHRRIVCENKKRAAADAV